MMMFRQQVSPALLALALAAPAAAQLKPAIQPAVRPAVKGATVKVAQQEPQVHRIAGRGTLACNAGTPLYVKGETPPPDAQPRNSRIAGTAVTPRLPGQSAAAPYAEMLGGLPGEDSALRISGPLIDTIQRAELIIAGAPPRRLEISERQAPAASCDAVFGKGNGAVTLRLPLPDVATRTAARIRLYGFPRNLAETAMGGRLCFSNTGEVPVDAAISCGDIGPTNQPAPMVQDITLDLHPHVRFERLVAPVGGFRGGNSRIGGRVEIAGRNLVDMIFPGSNEPNFFMERQLGRTPTSWTGELYKDFALPGDQNVTLMPRVVLMRGRQRVEVNSWDTAMTSNGRPLSRVILRFERLRATGGR